MGLLSDIVVPIAPKKLPIIIASYLHKERQNDEAFDSQGSS